MAGLTTNVRKASKAKASLSNEGRISREYTITRMVQADGEMTEYEVGTELGYLLGEAHPDDFTARLVDFDIVREMSRGEHCYWTVTLRYSTLGTPTVNNSDSPFDQRVKRSWSTTEHTMYVFKDRNGDVIVNAANQPFDGGIPVTLELPTLTFERNEPTFDGGWATSLSNSLNNAYYSGAERKTLKMKISATEQYEGDYVFWPVKYEMAYLPIGWQPQPLNAGLRQLKSGKIIDCVDSHLKAVTAAVPLALTGAQLAAAELPASANFIEVDWFGQMNFGGLDLPELT